MAFTVVNRTPLPPPLTKEEAIHTLQQHSPLIDANPLVISHTVVDENTPLIADHAQENKDCVVYKITDRLPILPCYSITTTYTAAFKNTPTGIATHVEASGVITDALWNVVEEEEKLVIVEDVSVQCSFLVSWYVKKMLSDSHTTVHDSLINYMLSQRNQ